MKIQFNQMTYLKNMFSKTGRLANAYVKSITKTGMVSKQDIIQKNLPNKTKALSIDFSVAKSKYYTNSQDLIVFKPDGTQITRTYSNVVEKNSRIYSSDTTIYQNGNPYDNYTKLKLFKDGKRISSRIHK